MLILTRKANESIIIDSQNIQPGQPIRIQILAVKNNGTSVRIGIEANKNISVHREEVYQRIHHKNVNQTNN